MAKNDETTVSQEDVWSEHLDQVHVAPHWIYLGSVMGGAFLLMVALMAVLGAGG